MQFDSRGIIHEILSHINLSSKDVKDAVQWLEKINKTDTRAYDYLANYYNMFPMIN